MAKVSRSLLDVCWMCWLLVETLFRKIDLCLRHLPQVLGLLLSLQEFRLLSGFYELIPSDKVVDGQLNIDQFVG
mgnify:CR=1 FL=1